MKKEQVFSLQHACSYTREGIKLLLKELSNGSHVKLIDVYEDLQSSRVRPLHDKEVDFFVLGLQGNSENHGGMLDFIIRWLPMQFPQAKVVIMAQTHSFGRLKDYLLGLGNVSAVLDNSIALADLRQHLQNIISNTVNTTVSKKPVSLLTRQEISVLGHLLQGTPVLTVADILQINPKTVSTHKRAALNKLGISSLHGLMKCGNNTHIMGELLSKKRDYL